MEGDLGWLKRIHHFLLDKSQTRSILGWMIAAYVRLAHISSRWDIVDEHIPRRLWDQKTPFIVAFWHGRLLMMPFCWRCDRPVSMLISGHRDGRLIAASNARLGISTLVGSVRHGGSKGLRAMLRALKTGISIGITPDGPRGPLMRVSPGVIALARLSQVPILPVSLSLNIGPRLKSWDKFQLALPFARGVIVWGELLEVSRDADAKACEAARLLLEERLNTLTRYADAACGRISPVPGPIS